ncbi:cytochrome P450 [Dichomitus squalens LYAD-421 SS1]|uniref:cytochrome P450 n=1 Tax=Dichomitus squalens (strain LYAD-421) TaxID=732165 RepID=UPI00044129B7|nr:cytochrome P450 [Dichomitus squalens LYAD-421 SS1]EJF63262.1 cytochrome P450 [Dichomitus squalens LYAD-421 SS1]
MSEPDGISPSASSPTNQRWRDHRRLFSKHFHPDVLHRYWPAQRASTLQLLQRLLGNPENMSRHVRYMRGATINGITYGLQVAESNDRYIGAFESGNKSLELLIAVTFVLDFLPALGRLPAWHPGAGFLRYLEHALQGTWHLRNVPWSAAREAVSAGRGRGCIAQAIIEQSNRPGHSTAMHEEEQMARDVAGAVYIGAMDTSYSAICNFFVAMSLFPDVQRHSQAELDAVVVSGRLPELTDRDALPYTNTIVKEILRWNTIGPLGIAHSSTSDDEYRGYFIPAKSTVMVNIWSILHDPNVFPEPEKFNPERFLKDGQLDTSAIRDPADLVFGFGRRFVFDPHILLIPLFMIIASVLRAFTIRPPLDKNGQSIRIQPRATSTLVS